jgi:molecular chaperone DnaK
MTSTINYGIDLGTTNSSIALFDGSEIRVFKNRDQNELTPSVVRIDKTGRIIVGKRAYQTLFLDPENVSSEFKRLMGQSDKISFSAVARSLSPEELSAEVLKSLLADARLQINEKIESAENSEYPCRSGDPSVGMVLKKGGLFAILCCNYCSCRIRPASM